MNGFCLSHNIYVFSALPVSFSHHVGGFSQIGMGFVHCSQLSLSVLGEKHDTDCLPPSFELYAERDGFNRRPLPLHTKGERALCD